jgi:TPR repeat protein
MHLVAEPLMKSLGNKATQETLMMKRAAEKGSTGAANDLSRLYLLGAPGVPASRPESLKWLAVSAGRGNAEPMVTLGYMSMTTPRRAVGRA